MATKKCKHCQTEIDAKARVCPQCRGKLGTSTATGCLAAALGGIAVFIILPMMLCNPTDTPMPARTPPQAEQARPAQPVQTEHAAAQGPENSCEKHIELHGSKFWAKELGKSEMWVLTNHPINLWQYQGTPDNPNMGRKMGEMRVGSRALILEEKVEDYRVRSPLDESVGWVSKIQVAHTLYQDVNTFESCIPPK